MDLQWTHMIAFTLGDMSECLFPKILQSYFHTGVMWAPILFYARVYVCLWVSPWHFVSEADCWTVSSSGLKLWHVLMCYCLLLLLQASNSHTFLAWVRESKIGESLVMPQNVHTYNVSFFFFFFQTSNFASIQCEENFGTKCEWHSSADEIMSSPMFTTDWQGYVIKRIWN